MRKTITLLATTLGVAAAITGTASAATLYTTAAHTTPVAVGTTIVASNPASTPFWIYNALGNVSDICSTNSMAVKVTQNSGGVFKADLLWQQLLFCASASWNDHGGGSLQISGSSTTVGTNKSWAATTLTGSLTVNGGSSIYTENFTGAGVSARQPVTGATPVSIELDHASSITGPVLTPGKVSGTYRFPGTYSLG
jgi:hypothetical protein